MQEAVLESPNLDLAGPEPVNQPLRARVRIDLETQKVPILLDRPTVALQRVPNSLLLRVRR
ncbi:MAG: hypothetical protein WD556_11000 [Actinomycetota bacterium]